MKLTETYHYKKRGEIHQKPPTEKKGEWVGLLSKTVQRKKRAQVGKKRQRKKRVGISKNKHPKKRAIDT